MGPTWKIRFILGEIVGSPRLVPDYMSHRVELKMNKFPYIETQSRDFGLVPDCSTYRENPMDISPTSRRFSKAR